MLRFVPVLVGTTRTSLVRRTGPTGLSTTHSLGCVRRTLTTTATTTDYTSATPGATTVSTRCSSTTTTPNATTTNSNNTVTLQARDVLALGGHKWSQMEPARYQELVQAALQQGVTTLEAGQDGGEAALLQAYQHAQMHQPTGTDRPNNQAVTVLTRVGYRTIAPPRGEADVVASASQNDDAVRSTTHSPATFFLPLDIHVEDIPAPEGTDPKAATKSQVVHNVGKEYLQKAIQASPLLNTTTPHDLRIVPLLHNPEVQVILMQDKSPEQRQNRIKERLQDAFLALEEQIQAGTIASYGIASNGLGLPSTHPLHLDYRTILQAAAHVRDTLGHAARLSVVQIPANVLETNGLAVARDLHAAVSVDPDLLPHLELHCMRPLTCYPDAGTGTGHPFVVADYQMPATMEKKLSWTNEMTAPPELYDVALKSALQHFDAEEILQAKQDGIELSADQRETLDGCKLLQSLLHDVDVGLDNLRSFRAHEQDLYQKIIPLIHDTFESYDDETARVLQSFFAAYSMAVRYAIARNTRKLLQHGENHGKRTKEVPVYEDLPPTTRLQEFGLDFVLKAKVFDKLVVGCRQPDQILDDLDIIQRFLDGKLNVMEEKDTQDQSTIDQ